jgi:hypothetical protein
MNWGDERWVKLYTRDTADFALLSWRAQGLFCLLMRKTDRAGVLELGRHGKRGVCAYVGGPDAWPDIEPALDELLADGCIELQGDQLLVRNYVEAQRTRSSDSARQAKTREAARASVRSGTPESQPVTRCHTASRIEENRTEEKNPPNPPPADAGRGEREPPKLRPRLQRKLEAHTLRVARGQHEERKRRTTEGRRLEFLDAVAAVLFAEPGLDRAAAEARVLDRWEATGPPPSALELDRRATG